MLFDVPFLNDESYCAFLAQHQDRIHSMHLSIAMPRPLDSRSFISRDEVEHCITHLRKIPRPRKYLLLNSRFYHPDLYTKGDELRTIVWAIDRLIAENCLHGLIIADFYLLQALSRHVPDRAATLEVVPSINCMIDNFDRLGAALEIISASRFKMPSKCILDRSLNRHPVRLQCITAQIRDRYPGLKIELIANEGCLPHCPFKPAHDAYIAFANITCDGTDIFRLNSDFGCVGLLNDRPEALFRSPFIRPEDVDRYEGMVDIVKICGRTLGVDFLINTVNAYLAGFYEGNLLDIMDTLEWLSHRLHVANEKLPPDFLDRITGCTGQCDVCSYCRALLTEHVRMLPIRLPDLRKH